MIIWKTGKLILRCLASIQLSIQLQEDFPKWIFHERPVSNECILDKTLMVHFYCVVYHPPEYLGEKSPTISERIYMPDPASHSLEIAMFSILAVQTKKPINVIKQFCKT